MFKDGKGSVMKQMLHNLCCDNGWSYGVFWRFNDQNSLLLTLQDAYCDEQSGVLVDDMVLQVHMLGEGLIGRAAFTKNHQYIFSDAHLKKQNQLLSTEGCEDNSEFVGQFRAGVKTIVVIPVEPFGVVQFGSFQKIPERMEFVDQTKVLVSAIMNGGCSSSNDEICGPSRLFASLISGANSLPTSSAYLDTAGEEEPMEATFSQADLIQTIRSSVNDQRTNPMENTGISGSYISNIQPQDSVLQSSWHFDKTVDGAPCSIAWNYGDSAAKSSALQYFPSQIRPSNSDELLTTKIVGNALCGDATVNVQERGTSLFCSGDLISDWDPTSWLDSSESKLQGPASLGTFEELFQENEILSALQESCPINEFSQLFASMPDQTNDMVAISLDMNHSQESGTTSASSNFKEHVKQFPESHPSYSFQSSITNLLSSVQKEKYVDSPSKKTLACLGKRGTTSGYWDNILTPTSSSSHFDSGTNYSSGILRPLSKFFPGSGIGQRSDDVTSSSCSIAISSLEDQLSSAPKRRKIETDTVKSTSFCRVDGSKNPAYPLYNLGRMNNLQHECDAINKSKMDSLIGASNSISVGKVQDLKQHEQLAKNVKKKAKPGTRPRPKDRQLIHDRLLELRKLIPNGEKMSIDGLLHRTIKQLLFLQCVTEHAERLKQIDEPKTVQTDAPSSLDCGVTWACEVGDETAICPLIVEDLSTRGQMSIEIQCEEQGFFLEIVDIIRGFGLTILKGLMEARESKIFARFTVTAEGNKQITRHEIFSSLIQLLQFSGPNCINAGGQLRDTVDRGPALFNTCQQSSVQLPLKMAETLHCGASL